MVQMVLLFPSRTGGRGGKVAPEGNEAEKGAGRIIC